MNRDFAEMLSALSAAGAEYLIVGAHALAAHGRPRATGDLDIWVRPTEENAHKVWAALARFGAPLSALKREDLSTLARSALNCVREFTVITPDLQGGPRKRLLNLVAPRVF